MTGVTPLDPFLMSRPRRAWLEHTRLGGGASRTLQSTGNVVIRGRLTIRPDSVDQQHLLVFQGVDESRFAGGGMDVLASDVGLWVVDAVAQRVAGSPRSAAGAIAGSSTLRSQISRQKG